MFESVFKDAIENKARIVAEQYQRATEAYNRARKDNPTMIERNIVDFSNPESVARMQSPIINPYGYNNPYANPSLVAQNASYNPALYAASSYGGTWYNGWGGTSADTARFMLAPIGDKRIPRGKCRKGAPEPIDRGNLSYTERKLQKPVVRVRVGSKEPMEEKKPTNTTNQFKIYKAELPYHEPHTPYTIEELNPDFHQLKMVPDTPLNWTQKDQEEVAQIAADLAVYDKALAHTAYFIYTWDEVTREDYNYFKVYFRKKIQEYREKELMNSSNIDYRAKYRYRPLPETYVNEDNEVMVYEDRELPVAIKTYTYTGEVVYSYDRGRDWITEEEWDIFLDKAFVDMVNETKKIKALDIIRMNKGLVEQPKKEEVQDNRYNPNDPISVKLNQMREREKSYNMHRDFFRHVYRNILTDEQFDNWWYGTNTYAYNQARGNQINQEEAQRAWARQMTVNNINFLNTLKPIDVERERQWANNLLAQAVGQYQNGAVRRDMSLAEFMKNLRYLGDTRVREYNLAQQKADSRRAYFEQLSRNTFKKGLYQFMNNPENNNPNPYYTPQYGTIDPRYGLPSHYVDLTNTPEAQEKRARFLHHCHTQKGTVPLSPIYR